MARKPISTTVMVKAAVCYKCQNYASVTMVDDLHGLIQCCAEHHIERFQQLLIERVKAILGSPELLEMLADLEHIRWAGWETYRREKAPSVHPSGDSYLHRWRRQEMTAYNELTEAEKESDRIEARKGLALIRAALLGVGS